jgi:anti-sigma factor RsiW
MSHCEYREKIGPFYDGELPREAERDVANHLRGCAVCEAELERLQRLSSVLRTARLPGIPEAALSRLHSRVWAASRLPVMVMFQMARRVALAAAVLLVVCVLWLWQVGGVLADAPEEWESAALASQAGMLAEVSEEELTARWILKDLSETEEN